MKCVCKFTCVTASLVPDSPGSSATAGLVQYRFALVEEKALGPIPKNQPGLRPDEGHFYIEGALAIFSKAEKYEVGKLYDMTLEF